jgi:hypothetical protein
MKFYGFGTRTRQYDEFTKSCDLAQGHATPLKKRIKKRFKQGARKQGKKFVKNEIEIFLNNEI